MTSKKLSLLHEIHCILVMIYSTVCVLPLTKEDHLSVNAKDAHTELSMVSLSEDPESSLLPCIGTVIR